MEVSSTEAAELAELLATDDMRGLRSWIDRVADAHGRAPSDWPNWIARIEPFEEAEALLILTDARSLDCLQMLCREAFAATGWTVASAATQQTLHSAFMRSLRFWNDQMAVSAKLSRGTGSPLSAKLAEAMELFVLRDPSSADADIGHIRAQGLPALSAAIGQASEAVRAQKERVEFQELIKDSGFSGDAGTL